MFGIARQRPRRTLALTLSAVTLGLTAACAGFGTGALGDDEGRLPRITLDPLTPVKGQMFRIEYDFERLPQDDVVLRVSYRPSGGITDHSVSRIRPWVEVFAPPMADFVSIEDLSGSSARKAATLVGRGLGRDRR